MRSRGECRRLHSATSRHWCYQPDWNMSTYVKRHWNEPRGDEHDAWGTSWWYFEVDDEGRVLRQIEQYDSGVRLRAPLET